MKFHDTLNEKLFNIDTMEMLPEVREKLLEIADSFIEFLEIPEDAVLDKVVTGSSASYNYNKYSDLDLHIIVDYDKVHEDCPLVNGYLNSLKKQFNDNHDIFIHGVPVELYAEQKDQGTVHNGLYSLQTGWIDKPQKIEPTDNDAAVEAKFNEIKELVDKCEDSEEAQELIDKIYNMRKAGLAEAGEFCTENLAFKKLRNEGCMDKLRKIKKEQIDKQLSLESYNESETQSDLYIVKVTAPQDVVNLYLDRNNYHKDWGKYRPEDVRRVRSYLNGYLAYNEERDRYTIEYMSFGTEDDIAVHTKQEWKNIIDTKIKNSGNYYYLSQCNFSFVKYPGKIAVMKYYPSNAKGTWNLGEVKRQLKRYGIQVLGANNVSSLRKCYVFSVPGEQADKLQQFVKNNQPVADLEYIGMNTKNKNESVSEEAQEKIYNPTEFYIVQVFDTRDGKWFEYYRSKDNQDAYEAYKDLKEMIKEGFMKYKFFKYPLLSAPGSMMHNTLDESIKESEELKVGDIANWNNVVWVKINSIDGNKANVSPIHQEDIDSGKFEKEETVLLNNLRKSNESIKEIEVDEDLTILEETLRKAEGMKKDIKEEQQKISLNDINNWFESKTLLGKQDDPEFYIRSAVRKWPQLKGHEKELRDNLAKEKAKNHPWYPYMAMVTNTLGELGLFEPNKNESIEEISVDEDVDTLEKKMDDVDTTLKDLMDKINGMSEEVEDTEFDIDKANNLIDEALKED